jgi:hypothetical protein
MLWTVNKKEKKRKALHTCVWLWANSICTEQAAVL